MQQNQPKKRQIRLEMPKGSSAIYAKSFLRALQENIDKHEDKHGEIKVPQRQSLAEQLFGSVKPGQDEDNDE